MNFSELITAQYWFSDPSSSITLFPDILLFVFIALFLIGLTLKVYFRKGSFHPVMRKFLKPIPGHLIRWGIVGALLTFFRMENVHYLSWRFLWIVFAVWVVYMIAKKILFFRKEYPRRMEMYLKRNDGKEWEVRAKKKRK